MKYLKTLLIVFVSLALTASFSLNAKEKPTWTILIYGHGDHNLSISLVDDMIKMEKVGSSDTFRIVCQADFDASQKDDNAAYGLPEELSKGVSRFLMTQSDDENALVSKPVMRLPELNMDDPDVLFEFLDWGIKTYPADRYAIVFSDHGGQWFGFGGDSQDGTCDDSTPLLPEDIAQTIRKALTKHDIKKVDFITFDACLMGGIEVIDYFRGLCDCFIACPELDFGDGGNYEDALGWLKKHPDATMEEYGKVEVKAWEKLHMDNGKISDLQMGAHAAYDMKKYPAVREAFLHFSKTLVTEFSPKNMILPRMRRLTAEYDAGNNPPDYIDLGGFAKGFASANKVSAGMKKNASALAEAIEAMVIAKAIGEDKLGASGLSIWYPLLPSANGTGEEGGEAESEGGEAEEESGEEGEEEEGEEGEAEQSSEAAKEALLKYFDGYKKIALFRECSWANYLEKVLKESDCHEEDQMEMKLSGITKKLAASDTFKAAALIKETPGAFQLHCSLFRPEGKGKTKKYIAYGEVATIRLNGSGKYPVKWKPALMHLAGETGKSLPLAVYPMNATGEYWYSYAEMKLPGRKKTSDILLVIRVKNGKPQLVNVLEDSEKLSPVSIKLRKGAAIIPVYIETERKGKDPDKWQRWSFSSKGSVVVPEKRIEGLRIEFLPLKPGRYLMDFELENVAAELNYPVSVPFTVTK